MKHIKITQTGLLAILSFSAKNNADAVIALIRMLMDNDELHPITWEGEDIDDLIKAYNETN